MVKDDPITGDRHNFGLEGAGSASVIHVFPRVIKCPKYSGQAGTLPWIPMGGTYSAPLAGGEGLAPPPQPSALIPAGLWFQPVWAEMTPC